MRAMCTLHWLCLWGEDLISGKVSCGSCLLFYVNLRWLLWSGKVNFWYNNWLGDGPLAEEISVVGDVGL